MGHVPQRMAALGTDRAGAMKLLLRLFNWATAWILPGVKGENHDEHEIH